MNKPTFTQGPWASEDNRDGVTEFYPKDRYPCMQPIASCYAKDVSEHAKEENRANARLIAAAPELYEQCKFLEKVLTEAITSGDSGADLELDQLRELLAKVEGEK